MEQVSPAAARSEYAEADQSAGMTRPEIYIIRAAAFCIYPLYLNARMNPRFKKKGYDTMDAPEYYKDLMSITRNLIYIYL